MYTIFPSNDGIIRWRCATPTPLEKARNAPDSMKAKILLAARRVFGTYGYHGATTRMIAKEVGIDISTLYYHWGEKSDLYEAVVFDIAEDLRLQLRKVEKVIHGKPLAQRLEISIEMMTDYLFDHPEISNLTFFRYFGKTRPEMDWIDRVPEFISDIARSMGITEPDGSVATSSKMQIWALTMAINNFVSGEELFQTLLNLKRDDYIPLAKETLKFILIPAFAGCESASPQASGTKK